MDPVLTGDVEALEDGRWRVVLAGGRVPTQDRRAASRPFLLPPDWRDQFSLEYAAKMDAATETMNAYRAHQQALRDSDPLGLTPNQRLLSDLCENGTLGLSVADWYHLTANVGRP